jgi:hypothetical protein
VALIAHVNVVVEPKSDKVPLITPELVFNDVPLGNVPDNSA